MKRIIVTLAIILCSLVGIAQNIQITNTPAEGEIFQKGRALSGTGYFPWTIDNLSVRDNKNGTFTVSYKVSYTRGYSVNNYEFRGEFKRTVSSDDRGISHTFTKEQSNFEHMVGVRKCTVDNSTKYVISIWRIYSGTVIHIQLTLTPEEFSEISK